MDRKQKVLELMKEVQKLNLKLENKLISTKEATEKIKLIYEQIEDIRSEKEYTEENKKEIEEKNMIDKLIKSISLVQDYALTCLECSENIDLCKNIVKAVNFLECSKQLF